jgi:hypothetical protein
VASNHDTNQAARVERLCHVDVVDPSSLAVANKHGRFTSFLSEQERTASGFFEEPRWAGLTDQDFATNEFLLWQWQTICFEVSVGFFWLESLHFLEGAAWLFDFFDLTTREPSAFCVVGSVEGGATETEVD